MPQPLYSWSTGNGFFLTALSRTYLAGEPTANINDHQRFDTRLIKAGEPHVWPEHELLAHTQATPALEAAFESHDAAAFLIVKDGQIAYERYLEPYDARSRTNSFSVAKTVVTLLLGIAIEDGLIAGLEQPLTDWLPELADDPLAATATVGSLSTMTSGYDWDEHYYSPFSPTVELYYTGDVADFLLERGFSDPPGERFYYSSASTQLLGIVLSRALAAHVPEATLAEYLSATLWQPLGMNDDALWHTDGQGMELAYCCINTNARNFAKLGQLMLQLGDWQGRSLVPAEHVALVVRPEGQPAYGYSTWLSVDKDPAFFAMRGHLGQYVVVVPEHNMVLVRLGEQHHRMGDTLEIALPFYIGEALAMLAGAEESVRGGAKP